jgi:leucyl aminopeptidase
MQIDVKSGDPLQTSTAALVVGVIEESERQPPWTVAVNRALDGALAERIAAGDMRGKLGEVAVVAGRSRRLKAERVVAVGLGKLQLLDLERLRRATGRVVRWLDDGRTKDAALLHHLITDRTASGDQVRATAEAAVLAGFRSPAFGEKGQLAGGSLSRVTLLAPETTRVSPALSQAARAGQVVAESANLARHLAELPGNQLPPRLLAAAALAVKKETSLQVTVYEEDWIRKRKMGALLGVAQGSVEPPRFVVLEHHPRRRAATTGRARRRRAPHIALVGKGVTFDTGGISLKPREDMERMKYDMSGAAAVLGALRAASLLNLPMRVTGIIPTVENMPSGTAVKPGDVLMSMAGKSIEVVNTDAEGRLILADALAFAAELKPDAIVDIATLTGACRIALGAAACGLMGNDPSLIEELQMAGESAGEAAWPLPLFNEYADDITSDVADLKNSGGRSAGALTAGIFLRAFVGEHSWAHLDIAGPAWVDKDKDYLKPGSAGFGVRLFTRFLEARA